MPEEEPQTYEEALEQKLAELQMAQEIEQSMTVRCMNCFGTGRVPIPKESEPDENGIVGWDQSKGLAGLLESVQAQHMDIRPGEVSDDMAAKLVKGSGFVGALMAMSNNGFTTEQSRDVIRRSGLSDAEIQAELDEIEKMKQEDDDL